MGYFAYLKRDPEPDLTDLLRLLVSARYSDRPTTHAHEAKLLAMVEQKEIRGLAHLVSMILILEASFYENTEKNQSIFRGVIMEELQAKNVPFDYIHHMPYEL